MTHCVSHETGFTCWPDTNCLVSSFIIFIITKTHTSWKLKHNERRQFVIHFGETVIHAWLANLTICYFITIVLPSLIAKYKPLIQLFKDDRFQPILMRCQTGKDHIDSAALRQTGYNTMYLELFIVIFRHYRTSIVNLEDLDWNSTISLVYNLKQCKTIITWNNPGTSVGSLLIQFKSLWATFSPTLQSLLWTKYCTELFMLMLNSST